MISRIGSSFPSCSFLVVSPPLSHDVLVSHVLTSLSPSWFCLCSSLNFSTSCSRRFCLLNCPFSLLTCSDLLWLLACSLVSIALPPQKTSFGFQRIRLPLQSLVSFCPMVSGATPSSNCISVWKKLLPWQLSFWISSKNMSVEASLWRACFTFVMFLLSLLSSSLQSVHDVDNGMILQVLDCFWRNDSSFVDCVSLCAFFHYTLQSLFCWYLVYIALVPPCPCSPCFPSSSLSSFDPSSVVIVMLVVST